VSIYIGISLLSLNTIRSPEVRVWNSYPVGNATLVKTVTFRDRNSKINTDLIRGLWLRFRLLDEEALEMYGNNTSDLNLDDQYLEEKYEGFYTNVLRPPLYRFIVMKNGCLQFYSSAAADPLMAIHKRSDFLLVIESELDPVLRTSIAAEITNSRGGTKCYLCYLFEYTS
jgi:hypothetical protein